MATTNRSFRAKSDIVSEGNVEATGVLKSTQSQTNEGGEIQLSLPSSGSTLSSGVNIDVYQNRLRIFEAGGTNRGAYIDLSSASAGVGSDLLAGGGGSSTLDGLTDVTITSITDNEILQYDSGTSSWINQTFAEAGLVSGVGTTKISYQTTAPTSPSVGDIWIDSDATVADTLLDDLGDVTITSIASGEILAWDGTSWINRTLSEAGIAALSGATFTGNINLNYSGPTIASNNASTASIFTSSVTGVLIGSSSITTTLHPSPGTTTSTDSSKAGYLGMPQILNPSSPYTLTAADAGDHIYFTSGTNTVTIPQNTSVTFPIGTTIVIINGPSAGNATINIATDTLRQAGTTNTGTRTLAANGMATIVKVASTLWYISGTGLT